MDRITIQDNEEYLRQRSSEVDLESDNYLEMVDKLKDYCTSHYCYALAPCQIGIPKRIIYIKNSKQDMTNNIKENYNEAKIYINPTIISSKGHTRFLEGCESCMYVKDGINIHLVGVIDRPYSVLVEYYDINGEKQQELMEGFQATVFSHEYDHLDGILHIDKTNEVMEMTIDEMREFRNKHPYEILSKEDELKKILN